MRKKVLVVFGTRPEAIKMASVVHQLEKYTHLIETKVCVTAQHRKMLDQVLDIFQIVPDFDLNIMQNNQNLHDITEKITKGMEKVLSQYTPDLVLVHGDTSTAFVTALNAFYHKIPVGHVEAGLRSGNIYSPWPEEANRKLIADLASFHFAPTLMAKDNLLKENVKLSDIYVTGNTVIDALHWILNRLSREEEYKEETEKKIITYYDRLLEKRKFILITGHRRENFGEGFIQICQAILVLAKKYPEIDFVYPVHPNPNVQKPVYEILGGICNVYLTEALEYELFAYLMDRSYLVLTDSGGLQEEAPSLSKPVLVMRENTERPEAIEAGTARLVGAESQKIIDEVSLLVDDDDSYRKMSLAVNPYGNGTAAEKIVGIILKTLQFNGF